MTDTGQRVQQVEPARIRRVVTGHDPNHVARVFMDGAAENVKFPGAGVRSTLVWCSDSSPAEIGIGPDFEDMGMRKLGSAPPAMGTRFAVLDFPPGNPPVMHRTESIDYVIVLSGEIEMDMDESTVKLRAGDILVQRGTNHAWANRGQEHARVAFVLIDATPLGIGKPVAGNATASQD